VKTAALSAGHLPVRIASGPIRRPWYHGRAKRDDYDGNRNHNRHDHYGHNRNDDNHNHNRH